MFTGQYFTMGHRRAEAVRRGRLTPNTDGWIAEIAYIPFVGSNMPGWPWFNARVGLQYTWYNKLNGTTVGASANNTLFLYLWLAM